MLSTCGVLILRKKMSFPERRGKKEGHWGWWLAHLFSSHAIWWGKPILSVLGRAVVLLRPPPMSPISLFLSSKQKRGRVMQSHALTPDAVHSAPSLVWALQLCWPFNVHISPVWQYCYHSRSPHPPQTLRPGEVTQHSQENTTFKPKPSWYL